MKRSFVLFISIALLAALIAPDTLAKRSRSGRKSSQAHSKREARGKPSRGREARGKSSRGREARRGRSERASRGGKLSRRERRALARSERGERSGRSERGERSGRSERGERSGRSERGGRLARERVVVRGRHGRRLVRYRYVRRRSEPDAAPVAAAPPRPSGSGIPAERVSEIQNALIKAGFLDGPASGQYDDATIQAMKQFQAANRFPETGTPSAMALKKLGVAKRSNDGFAMPVNNVSESERKQRPPQTP